jgi:hypothetical protein
MKKNNNTNIKEKNFNQKSYSRNRLLIFTDLNSEKKFYIDQKILFLFKTQVKYFFI